MRLFIFTSLSTTDAWSKIRLTTGLKTNFNNNNVSWEMSVMHEERNTGRTSIHLLVLAREPNQVSLLGGLAFFEATLSAVYARGDAALKEDRTPPHLLLRRGSFGDRPYDTSHSNQASIAFSWGRAVGFRGSFLAPCYSDDWREHCNYDPRQHWELRQVDLASTDHFSGLDALLLLS